MTQISLFDGENPLKIDKPIRLIELFAGYGSQSLALDYLGANYESWKICEWAVKSIQAYKDIHCPNDNNDYSNGKSKEELINDLFKLGISADYSNPMTREQIARLAESQLRTIYNNIKATNNLVSVCNCKGKYLEIVDVNKYCYVMTYSFPCQDLSNAGQGKGMKKGSGTRSGLLWEVERILNECYEKPQILLMENVPDVHGTNNIKDFAKWVQFLESIGYHCYWQDLNGKDYGIPQNRNRCFMVSCLGDYYYDFPQPIMLEKRLKDLLEDTVDEKFYLSGKMIQWFQNHTEKKQAQGCGFKFEPTNGDGIGKYISTRAGSRADDNFIQEPMFAEGKTMKFKKSNVSGTLLTNSNFTGAGVQLVAEPIAYDEQNQYLRTDGTVGTLTTDGSSPKHNNRIVEYYLTDKQLQQMSNWNSQQNPLEKVNGKESICPTITTRVAESQDGGISASTILDSNQLDKTSNLRDEIKNYYGQNDKSIAQQSYRIRKLTPRECFRLMGVRDEDFEKVAKNQSNSSLYHLAGDSIIVNVLSAIFKEML